MFVVFVLIIFWHSWLVQLSQNSRRIVGVLSQNLCGLVVELSRRRAPESVESAAKIKFSSDIIVIKQQILGIIVCFF